MADAAEAGLGGFTWEMYGHRYPYELGKEDRETAVSDFLGDLMHYCDREEINFEDALAAGRRHYEVEATYDWNEEVGLDPKEKE